MKRALLVCCLLGTLAAQAQPVTFESGVPTTWTTSGPNTLSVSHSHYKGGDSSLKWIAAPNQVLTVSSLNVSSSVVGSVYSGTTHFWLYSEEVSADTLIVDFLDNLDAVRRRGRVLMNFKGWRDYHRNYAIDYGEGDTLPGFSLKKVQFTLKKSGMGNKTIWIDEVKWSGDMESRFPGPHMLLDAGQFGKGQGFAGGEPLTSWLNVPDIAIVTPSNYEKQSIGYVSSRTAKPAPATPTVAAVSEAKAYVTSRGLSESNGIVTGRGLLTIHHQDTLVKLAGYCSTLARAYLKSSDTVARTQLLLFTRYLIDQGVAEGGRNVITTNTYLNAREFTDRFMDAIPVYTDSSLKKEVIRMLKWSNEFNKIYSSNFRNNMDFVHTKITHLFRLAVLDSDSAVMARDLKSISGFLKRTLEPRDGAIGGLKPDGLGFHHLSKYTHYMYSYATWIDAARYVRATAYKVSKEAYDLMLFAVKTILLESNAGKVRSNATAGRFPFPDDLPFDSTDFKNLITVGSDITGTTTEPVGASLFNYFYQTQRYSGVPQVNLDGYHQFNYGQMGVLRRKNWIAVSRGLTDKMFGSEIYVTANRYGRYQSYGALEILYKDLPSTGYITNGAGWDWKVMPGTTAVYVPYDTLDPNRETATEYQGKSFAGALAAGDAGVFAIDFEQRPGLNYYKSNNLTFRKSVFAFDTILVCLGTKINGTGGSVATSIFQAINATSNPAIYINSTTATSANGMTTLQDTTSNWLLTAQTTGFYIPQRNQEVKIMRGPQATPIHSDTVITNTVSANASKAWILHGSMPNNAQYEYAVVPGTTPAAMQSLADSMAQDKVYEVLAKTNDYHAVKYLPGKISAYAFFAAATNVNLGYLQSVTSHSLITIKELGDTVVLRIANPDLNTSDGGLFSGDWVSNPSSVTVNLTQSWQVIGSSSSGTTNSVSATNFPNSIQLDFVLHQGNYTEVTLVKDETQMGSRLMADTSVKAIGNYEKLQVFPTPASDKVVVTCFSTKNYSATLQLIGLDGKKAMQVNRQLSIGRNRFELDITRLRPGMYFIQVGNEVARIIKQ